MALKTLVKVGRISNLSDVRYCAGMGVDMVGFQVIPGKSYSITPEHFKDMRGWFTGPSVVAEIYGSASQDEVTSVVQNFIPDYLEGSCRELPLLPPDARNFILYVTQEDWRGCFADIIKHQDQIAFVLVNEADREFVTEVGKTFKVIAEVSQVSLAESLFKDNLIQGIALRGSAEEKPGLKSYDQLAEILEALEAE